MNGAHVPAQSAQRRQVFTMETLSETLFMSAHEFPLDQQRPQPPTQIGTPTFANSVHIHPRKKDLIGNRQSRQAAQSGRQRTVRKCSPDAQVAKYSRC